MVNVKRYYAATARDALRMVKEELGSDAVVLSNRAVDGGIEILALPASEVGVVQAAARNVPVATPAPRYVEDSEDFHVSLSTRIARPSSDAPPGTGFSEAVHHVVSDRNANVRPFMPRRVDDRGNPAAAPVAQYLNEPELPYAARNELRTEATRGASPMATSQRAAAHRPQPSPQRETRSAESERAAAEAERQTEQLRRLEANNSRLVEEMGAIRGMIESQLAGFAWGELTRSSPLRAQVMSDLLEAGFSASLARELTEAVPEGISPEQARTRLRTQINRRLLTLESESDLIERGGVYALVGPTGVGKTTTTAKLAARCVVRHGADKLALITTDGYRIGAHEQLRIYGRILGVPVHIVRDGSDLRRTLQDLSKKHMVLIDTIGMSQRDRMVGEQAAMLTGAGSVRRLLLLNATNRGDTLEDVVRAYEGPDLAGCILTKTDEAASLAPALDVLVRNELRAYYVANGQRVPEDLHLPNRSWLVHRSLRELAPESPFRITPEEAGLVAAASRNRSVPGARA